jgi:uncharacterized protein (TIGR03067 family)
MHQIARVAVLTAIVAIACCASASAGNVEDKDQKAIEGTWLPTAAELAGQEFPAEVRKMIKLIMAGDKYTAFVGENPDEGTVALDSSKSPKAMTIKGTKGPNQGKTFLAIYELKDDTLRICYDLSGKAFPAEFKTKPGTQLYLVTYERKK